MVPSGEITEQTFRQTLDVLDPGDTIVDGGNSYFRDSIRRHEEAAARGVRFVDVGVSGGIWGLEVGFCLMAGGEAEAVQPLEPVLRSLAPEDGYAHVGGPGSGHYVKMVHNGIEYGLMEAYAEGFELMSKSEFDLDLAEISGIWRYGSVVRSWLLELLHEAFGAEGNAARADRRLRRGLRRGPLDDERGDRQRRADARARGVALRPLLLAGRHQLLRQGRGSAPEPVRRARGPGRAGSGHRPRVVTVAREENPLLEGLRVGRTPEPCAIVIFGASGDLTHRKLFPALYSLAYRRLLPDEVGIVGVARTDQSTEDFVEAMREGVQEYARDPFRDDVWDGLAAGIRYLAADFSDDGAMDELLGLLSELDEERGTRGNRLYYLAVPPQAFTQIVDQLGERKDRDGDGWTRLIVEKPFGHDLASAQELDGLLHRYFEEREIFRIDHYLGKETVQNMLALRFANGIFEPIWNRQFIDHVEITVAETMGIGSRAGFYERSGAIRDIFQNHLLQLLAVTAMEPPVDFDAESVRNEKVKVLRAVHTPGPKNVVRGQYGRGFVEGEEVPGYREESGVDPESHDRDVRRREAVRRQLALGRHAVLPPRREAARAPRDHRRDPVPPGAAPAVRRARRGGAAARTG